MDVGATRRSTWRTWNAEHAEEGEKLAVRFSRRRIILMQDDLPSQPSR